MTHTSREHGPESGRPQDFNNLARLRGGTPALLSPRDPTAEEARADALRGIAAAVVAARRQTDHMGRLRPQAGGDLLAECERHLSALIVVGAVPGPPDPDRRPLT